jgi:hypothetical protein
MSLASFVREFLDGFTPGWSRDRRRPDAPDYLFS